MALTHSPRQEVVIDWRQDAACRDHDPELWVINGPPTSDNLTAVQICHSCPVLEQCRTWAHQNRPSGVILAAEAWIELHNRHTGKPEYRSIQERTCWRCGDAYLSLASNARYCPNCRRSSTNTRTEPKKPFLHDLMAERYGPDGLLQERYGRRRW